MLNVFQSRFLSRVTVNSIAARCCCRRTRQSRLMADI
jgi:hypothetical protein